MGKGYDFPSVVDAKDNGGSEYYKGYSDSSTYAIKGDDQKKKAAVKDQSRNAAKDQSINNNTIGTSLQQDGGAKKEKKKNEKKKKYDQMVGTFAVFRFADRKDIVLLLIGVISSIAHGVAMPLMVIVFGSMSDSFINSAVFGSVIEGLMPNITAILPNITKETIAADPQKAYLQLEEAGATDILDVLKENDPSSALLNQMKSFTVFYCAIGVAVFVMVYVHTVCWTITARRQCQRIRSLLFKSILKQEIGWYDTHESGELNTRLADDVSQIEAGIGDKLGLFIQYFSTFLAGFVIGFYHGWKLTLVILAVSPLIVLTTGVMGKLSAVFTSRELNAYAKAGAVAEEVISSARTVFAYGGQKKEVERYCGNLHAAKRMGIKRGAVTGVGMGAVFLLLFSIFSLAFWYGSQLVWPGEYTGGTVILVFMCVLMGAFNMGNAAPNLQEFAQARGAAYVVYSLIDQEPVIDSSSEEGITPDKMIGNVEFKGVEFSYPSRPHVTVLDGLNLRVNVGQTVALVGSSGCGKSTTVQLLQRFYDPGQGQVLIDGHDLCEYNIKWLRQHIGVVSQEPVLFDTTIRENISYGKDGVSQEEIEAACRKANAHDFVKKLPNGYDTVVGERGTQLSGGQKQRIAIARALVRDPKILLLDEATSALDTESEASVQTALDKAREGRTTIVIAHRLSTIKNADVIAGFELGRIKEEGSHDELMQQHGIYHSLVTNQAVQDEEGHLESDKHPEKHADPIAVQPQMAYHRQRTISTGSTDHKMPVTDIDDVEITEKLPQPDMSRVFRMNSPEWAWMLVGSIASFIAGGVQPTFAVMLSEIMGVYAEIDPDEQRRQVNMYSGMMVVIGVVAAVAMFVMNYTFAYSGEQLTQRMRELTFKSLLKQEIGYFDDPQNTTGALCTRLSTDASAVKGATGIRLGTMIRNMSAIGVALGIGFYFSWKLSLVILAFAPLIMISGFIQARLSRGDQQAGRANLEEAGKIAVQAIENMRTVAALTQEQMLAERYYEYTHLPVKRSIKQSHGFGLLAGISQACIFFAYAASFTFGATLVEQGELKFEDLFKVVMAIVMGSISVGQANSFAPDYGKAKESAARCIALHDRQPLIDCSEERGKRQDNMRSDIEVENVEFVYPTRPNISVLRGLSLTVSSGQTVALVGSSGCGKSTVIQLLQRFYDPLSGQLKLDGVDTTELNLQWLRGKMGIVSQEPILFDASIQENIAYGDNSRQIPMDEIIQAAKDANIHNFIQALPNGYDTNVGDKGTQLSGGQKQRVAIARALVRNPQILLLDEATSALDTESEKVVQQALDRAQEGRTSIVIAHRLSTIQNSDKIIVIQKGQVAESGTHSELLAQKGFYHKLNMVQMRNAKK